MLVAGLARLNALAGSTDTSSWLRAPPIASLGLQIPPCDFSIACQLWLGIASFPADPPTRCPCGSQIDPPGYHLLSCGHGPWRIKRHDALRDTLYQALLLDNPEAAREQRLSGLTKKRPGDVFHPSFSNGRPTFFDVSVRSPLTLGNINIASQQPGWAGLCGEIEKENIHANSVEQSGGAFIPLVVETFGLWTPFARQQLRKIASGTTINSGLSVTKATNNLLQQLSVKLWMHNARIVLTRQAMSSVLQNWIAFSFSLVCYNCHFVIFLFFCYFCLF